MNVDNLLLDLEDLNRRSTIQHLREIAMAEKAQDATCLQLDK